MGLRPGDAVGREALRGLEAPERSTGEAAKHAVGRQGPVTGAIERQLQQLHRGADAARSQNSHFSPSFGHSICGEKEEKNGAFPRKDFPLLTF